MRNEFDDIGYNFSDSISKVVSLRLVEFFEANEVIIEDFWLK